MTSIKKPDLAKTFKLKVNMWEKMKMFEFVFMINHS